MPDEFKDSSSWKEFKAVEEKPHHLGHRERLKQRFMSGGGENLPDYELLELVLFRAIPRRDTKPIAKDLIARFGTFADCISAPPERLKEVKGVGDAVVVELKLIQAAALRLSRENVLNREALSSWSALMDYCKASMGYHEKEQFRILFLDRKNILIADEIQQEGTIDHTPVYTREVVKRALELSASAIILVHNHPSGDPTPSRADIEMTKKIKDACDHVGITVHDHIIVGREYTTSFKSLELL